MAKAAAVLVVLESFVCGRDFYRKGEFIDADHPAVKRWPDKFGPVHVQHRTPRIEQATAAPGEMRGES